MAKILNPFQKNTLREVGESKLSGDFVWSGGTALSYQYLQHRLSQDLDFLSKELQPAEYLLNQIKGIAEKLGVEDIEEQRKYNRHQFWLKKNKETLRVEFVFYPFPDIKEPTHVAKFNVKVDSVEDILTNKFHAVFERAEPKDIFDIYYILKKEDIEFLTPVEWVDKKFGVTIDAALLVSKILEGASKMKKIKPLVLKKKFYNPEKIEKYFEKKARDYLDKKIE